MGYTWLYTIIFFIIWIAILPLILMNASFEHVFTYVVLYGMGGLLLYLFIPFPVNIYLQKKEQDRYRESLETEENRRRFQRAQYLRQKYRTLKFEELLADSEINTSDKMLLLEFVYGYSPEDAENLLKGKGR